MADAISLESLLALPGVVDDAIGNLTADEFWPLVETALSAAIKDLATMRSAEGEAMATDILENVTAIDQQLTQVDARYPAVVEAYSNRLTERINKLLAEHDVTVEPADIAREVGLFAERSDIAEEIVRSSADDLFR